MLNVNSQKNVNWAVKNQIKLKKNSTLYAIIKKEKINKLWAKIYIVSMYVNTL
jgi:hypothetical protein